MNDTTKTVIKAVKAAKGADKFSFETDGISKVWVSYPDSYGCKVSRRIEIIGDRVIFGSFFPQGWRNVRAVLEGAGLRWEVGC